MNVLITTMHRGYNYGSALQAYALSEAVRSIGHRPLLLDYIPERLLFNKNLKHLLRGLVFGKNTRQRYESLRGIIHLLCVGYYFGRFFRRHLTMTKQYHNKDDIYRAQFCSDVYMTGSDQVWNSFHNQGLDKIFFLDFAPEGAKRIAYAASFGKMHLEDWEREETKKLLDKYQAISVRESQGLKILDDLDIHTGKHVLDPTLLLSREEWMKRCSLSKQKYERYLLVYTVEPNVHQLIEYAQEIAKKLSLKIYVVDWGFKKYPGTNKLVSNISPLQLMSYFLQADFVVASSFHGTAFSINANKPFITVSPRKFNSRVESLLKLLNLEGRLVDEGAKLDLDQITLPIDYKSVNSILDKERACSLHFLKHAIED